jgi:anti-sigma factor RsiW
MLRCVFRRRRLGAYLDGALPEPVARAMAAHVAGCPGCRREADELTRIRDQVRLLAAVPEPDWTGFWPKILRGIEGATGAVGARRRPRWLPRRVALAGALAVSLLAITVWKTEQPPPAAGHSVVDVADTEHPDASVMVYTPSESDMTVIWVFGLDGQAEASAI